MEESKRACFMSRALTALFWIHILSMITNILTQDKVAEMVPQLYMPGLVVGIVCPVARIVLMFMMSSGNGYYRGSALLNIAGLVMDGSILFLPNDEKGMVGALILYALTGVAGMAVVYFEIRGHARLLQGVDDGLAEKWRRLGGWVMNIAVALMFGFGFMMVLRMIGLLVMVGVLIVWIIFEIRILINLYKSAQILKGQGR